MTNFESKNILPEDIENTDGKENKKQEYKSNLTKWHEQKAEEAKEKIKKLNEKFKKLIETSEEKKKGSDGLST